MIPHALLAEILLVIFAVTHIAFGSFFSHMVELIGTVNTSKRGTFYRLRVSDGESSSTLLKSIADFRSLHAQLAKERPASAPSLPWLPVLSPLTTNVVSRMESLNAYLRKILVVDALARLPCMIAFLEQPAASHASNASTSNAEPPVIPPLPMATILAHSSPPARDGQLLIAAVSTPACSERGAWALSSLSDSQRPSGMLVAPPRSTAEDDEPHNISAALMPAPKLWLADVEGGVARVDAHPAMSSLILPAGNAPADQPPLPPPPQKPTSLLLAPDPRFVLLAALYGRRVLSLSAGASHALALCDGPAAEVLSWGDVSATWQCHMAVPRA